MNREFSKGSSMRWSWALAGLAVAMVGGNVAAQNKIEPLRPGVTRPTTPLNFKPMRLQRGAGSFTSEFAAAAPTLNLKNAYILAFLSSAIYPDGLAKAAGMDLKAKETVDYMNALNLNRKGQDSNFFQTEFRDKLGYLFSANTKLTYLPPPRNRDNYDPEAMVIDMPEAIIVVFRGTDRVAAGKRPGTFEWEAGEWIRTDFRCGLMDPGGSIKGAVHEGMWLALRTERKAGDATTQYRRELLNLITAADPEKKKKLWITGHSLGGGFVQLFAAYCEDQGRNVQGAYTFAAPMVGTKEFADWVEQKVTSRRLQRFEFLDDPITLVGPQPIFAPAGSRNLFDGIRELKTSQPERNPLEFVKLAPALGQIINELIAGSRAPKNTVIDANSLNYMCFHYWEWYTAAAFNAMPRGERAKFPEPLSPLPSYRDTGCSREAVRRALEGDPVSNAIEDVSEVVEDIKYVVEDAIDNAKRLMENATGSVPEGTYYFRLLKDRKYMDVSGGCFGRGEDGCEVQLWDLGQSASNNKFRVKRDGPFYRIEVGSGNKVVEVKLDDAFENGGRIQTWSYNPLAPNQKWLFCKVGKGDNYVVINALSWKALDAVNSETKKNGGRLQSFRPRDNDPTQVWVLEKVR